MANSDRNIYARCIVCISDLFWDEHWSSEQQLMSRFAKNCTVLYVERPVSFFSFFTGISDASVVKQFQRWSRGGLRQEGDSLFVLTPPSLPPVSLFSDHKCPKSICSHLVYQTGS